MTDHLDDAEWLSTQLTAGRKHWEIANELGVRAEDVSNAAVRHHLTEPRGSDRFPQLADPAAWENWADRGLTIDQICDEIGCSPTSAYYWRRRVGVAHDIRAQHAPAFPEIHDPDWLRGQIQAGRSDQEIADQLGCSKGAVASQLSVFRAAGHEGLRRRAESTPLDDPDWLREQIDNGLTAPAIARLVDRSPSHVRRMMSRHGLSNPKPKPRQSWAGTNVVVFGASELPPGWSDDGGSDDEDPTLPARTMLATGTLLTHGEHWIEVRVQRGRDNDVRFVDVLIPVDKIHRIEAV